jgi:hypothetical protein
VHSVLLGVLLLAASQASHAQGLVSWWPGNGNYKDVISGNDGTPFGGVAFAPAFYGKGFLFDGSTGRIFVPDSPSLTITASLAITAWIKVNSFPQYPDDEGQILYRGDDRYGLDPYFLEVTDGGNLAFGVTDTNNNQIRLLTPPIPTGRFVFVAAVLDTIDEVHALAPMEIYVNGRLEALAYTSIVPLGTLDPNASPGVGIGDVQDGNYPEHFDGIINDLKIYNTANPQITPVKLHLSQSRVKGGSKVNATLTLNDSPITPVSASVSSTVAVATVPASVTIAAGRYSTGFVIKTQVVTTHHSRNLPGLSGILCKRTIDIGR